MFLLLQEIRKPTNLPKLRVAKELTSLQVIQVHRSSKFVESFKRVLQRWKVKLKVKLRFSAPSAGIAEITKR